MVTGFYTALPKVKPCYTFGNSRYTLIFQRFNRKLHNFCINLNPDNYINFKVELFFMTLIVLLPTNTLKRKNKILIWVNDKTKIKHKLIDCVTYYKCMIYSSRMYKVGILCIQVIIQVIMKHKLKAIPWIKKAVPCFYKGI